MVFGIGRCQACLVHQVHLYDLMDVSEPLWVKAESAQGEKRGGESYERRSHLDYGQMTSMGESLVFNSSQT